MMRCVRVVRRCIGMAMFWGALPVAAAGQSGSAAVAGTVRDSSGSVLKGVRVVLRNPDTGAVQQVTTGGAGAYEFAALVPASTLTLEASRDGFRPLQRVIDSVTAGERRLVDLRLQLAGVTEAIEVIADMSSGCTSSPELGSGLPREQIDRVPVNGGDLPALAYLIPGEAPARGFYNLAPRLTINGASSLVINYRSSTSSTALTSRASSTMARAASARTNEQGTLAFQPTQAGPARQVQFTARVGF